MKRKVVLLLVGLFLLLPSVGVFAAHSNTVIWGEDREWNTLDPRVSQSRHEVNIYIALFDTLIYRDYDGTLCPFLATAWENNEDNTEFTLWLRDDVTFHDGTPFNAEAVKYTFDSIVDPDLGSQAAVDYLSGENYKETVILDEYTVKVIFHSPFAAFLIKLTHPWLSVVSPTAATGRPDEFAENPVGTGPFMFKEWVRRDYVTVVRNPDYNWAPEQMGHQGPAYLEEITFKEIRSDPTRIAALEEGEIDIADNAPAIDAKRLEASGNFATIVGNGPGMPLALIFNLEDPVAGDIYVRMACNYAIDQADLVQKFAMGYREPAYGFLSPATVGYWPGVENFYKYDPGLAKTTLELGGWEMSDDGFYYKDGQKCSIYYPIIFRETENTIVQGELRKVGIDLQVTPVSKQQQDEIHMQGKGNMQIRWNDPDASILYVSMHSSNIAVPGHYRFNHNRLQSARVDELLALAEAAVTFDERNAIYAKLQAFEREMALTLPYAPVIQIAPYPKDLVGLRLDSRRHEVNFYDARWED